jgi:F-type H+-transporting ATPase subunit delta
MRLDRKHRHFTKRLARLSLGDDGQIDPARADAVLGSLRAYPIRLQRALLKAYLHYLEIEDHRGRLLYEYSGIISPAELESLRQHFDKKYGRSLRLELKNNSDLLAGLRVSIGDEVFEYSASNRLANLQAALA